MQPSDIPSAAAVAPPESAPFSVCAEFDGHAVLVVVRDSFGEVSLCAAVNDPTDFSVRGTSHGDGWVRVPAVAINALRAALREYAPPVRA